MRRLGAFMGMVGQNSMPLTKQSSPSTSERLRWRFLHVQRRCTRIVGIDKDSQARLLADILGQRAIKVSPVKGPNCCHSICLRCYSF